MERTILHCDLNCFFASVELLAHPELREVPMAVCGDPAKRHGVILAKNEPAKALGVKTAETIWQAQRKCPNLALLPAHHDQYQHYSRLIAQIYGRYTDLVEPFGIDESWLDVTGSMHLFGGSGKAVADELRRVVKSELNLTISVGVSFNKIFAKLGSDYKKPDATTVITRENFKAIVWPLPVQDLLFVGGAAAKLLGRYGVRTIGDLARFDPDALYALLGKQGATLHDYATGGEHSAVQRADAYTPPKSVGSGITFCRNLLGADEVRTGIALLADGVAMRLRKAGLKCTTVQVIIRDPNFNDLCRQKRLPAPTYISRDIRTAAMELLSSCWNWNAPIRALTVTGQNLVPENEATEQYNLFSAGAIPQRDKLEKLEHTMDAIRDKFGPEAIQAASLVRNGIEEPEGTSD